MANIRQYIGARYTIKIYENSQDAGSAEWEANTSYEPLVMVTYNNSSYLSKKDVPATIGNPAQNPLYWIVTGAYNGQIASLQEQINSIESTIQTLTNSTLATFLNNQQIVAYGDSSINVGRQGENSYLDFVCEANNSKLTNRAVPATNMNDTIIAINNSTDLTEFDTCIIGHGIAEFTVGISKTENARRINAIITALRNKNPNLSIIFILPYYIYRNFGNQFSGVRNALGMTINDYNHWCIEVLDKLKIPHINFYERSTCNSYNYTEKLLNDSGGVYVHPNDEFKKELASIVLNGCDITREDNIIGMIKNFDFTELRNNVTYNDILNNDGKKVGYALRMVGTQTKSSTQKLFLTGHYLLHGYCDNSFTITFGTYTYTISGGEFNIDIDVDSTFASAITLSSTGDVFINEFQLYCYSQYGDISINWWDGISKPLFKPTSGANEVVSLEPFVTGDDISFNSFVLYVFDYTALPANTPIYEFTNGVDFGAKPRYLVGHSTSGKTLLLNVNNNVISVGSLTDNDTYFFDTAVQPIPKQFYTV